MRNNRVVPAIRISILMFYMPTITSLPVLGIPFVDAYVFMALFIALASTVVVLFRFAGRRNAESKQG